MWASDCRESIATGVPPVEPRGNVCLHLPLAARQWHTVPDEPARLGALIEGFETPYGMEVLSSVHWVAEHDEPPARTPTEAVAAVRDWNPRKAKINAPRHVEKAWERLEEQGWISAVAVYVRRVPGTR